MHTQPDLPDPASSPELFEALLTRRVIAYLIDLVILGVLLTLGMLLVMILGLFTFGLAWIGMPVFLTAIILGYYAFTLGSENRATWGMMMMDIVVTPIRHGPLEGWRAIALPVVFWITCWVLPPFSLLLALFTPRRQLLQDLIVGVLLVRRSPMERHWRDMNTAGVGI